MRRSSVLLLLLLLVPLTTAAASPPPPVGTLMMVDSAGDANGVNYATLGLAGVPRDLPTAPAQVPAADIHAGRLAARWSGAENDRRLEGIDVRLRLAEAPSTVQLEYATYLYVDGCFLGLTARVGRGATSVLKAGDVSLWVSDTPECGEARGRSYSGGEMVRYWDEQRSELVVAVGTRRGPGAVRALLKPGATVRWSGSTSAGPTPTRVAAALDLAVGGEGTWVIDE